MKNPDIFITFWEVYEESRKGGAIIPTEHEHSYSRTHLLSNMQNQTIASTSDTLALSRDSTETPQDEGRSFVFLSGLRGHSVRMQLLSGPWWAAVSTATQGATYGALFGIFNFDGKKNLAKFYFQDINGAIQDEFYIRWALGGSARYRSEPGGAGFWGDQRREFS